MPGIAGKKALVKVGGIPVTLTNEATTDAGDHKNYQITTAARRVLDRATAVVVKNGGVAVNPLVDPFTVNRLSGTVTFVAADGARVITVSGKYVPLTSAVSSKNYTYSLARTALMDTDFDSANTNTGFNTYQAGQLDISGSVGRRITTDTAMRDALIAGDPVVIEFFSDRSAAADMVCWALLNKDQVQSAVDGMQEGSIDFSGAADDYGLAASVTS
jgi:hypothetical protein